MNKKCVINFIINNAEQLQVIQENCKNMTINEITASIANIRVNLMRYAKELNYEKNTNRNR